MEQDAGRIALLGQKIVANGQLVTDLGIELDAVNEQINLYIEKTDAVEDSVLNLGIRLDGVDESISIYASKIDANTDSIAALQIEVDSINLTVAEVQGDLDAARALAEAAQDTADEGLFKATSNASVIQMHADSISILNGRFAEDGALINTSGLVTESEFASLYSAHYDLEGEVSEKAELRTSVQYDPSSGTITSGVIITADIVDINNGLVRIDDHSARIGGFNVDAYGLVNDGFDNDAYIIFRNDSQKTFAGIGGNILPSTSGLRGVGRFENHDSDDLWALGTNYALLVSAQGANQNVAIQLNGGSVACLALKTLIIGHDNVIQSTAPTTKYVTLDRNVGSLYVSTHFNWKSTTSVSSYTSRTRDVYVTLPAMEVYDDGHILKIKRGSDNGNKVYLRPSTSKWLEFNSATGSFEVKTGSSYIFYNNADYAFPSDNMPIDSEGDAMELVYHRDLKVVKDGVEYRGCWIQHKHPRSW